MRVLISASTFPLRPGDGLPRFVLDLAQSLAASPCCTVSALAPDAPDVPTREWMGDVDVHRFRYFWPRRWQRLAYGEGMPDNLRRSWLARLQSPLFVLAAARATRALVRREGIDVVNSHWIVPQGLATALARGRSAHFRHVVTLHGGDSYLLRALPFGRQLARYIVERADAVVTVSSNVRDNLDAVLGRPSGAQVQPVGVHVERFRAPAARIPSPFAGGYLLFVGRLVPVKGVDVLLRALPRVRVHHPGLGLVIVGSGVLEGSLRELAGALGVADAVEFAGRRTHEEIAGYLQGCRAAVVPSIVEADGRAEGMPSVVLEALAAGARVVASESGGIPDTIRDGENGWLAPPGDPQALAARLLAALEEPAGSPLLLRARRSADALDWSRVAERTLALFADTGAALGR
jgi:glycosyltransferase involved in cell wall biosynthesis